MGQLRERINAECPKAAYSTICEKALFVINRSEYAKPHLKPLNQTRKIAYLYVKSTQNSCVIIIHHDMP